MAEIMPDGQAYVGAFSPANMPKRATVKSARPLPLATRHAMARCADRENCTGPGCRLNGGKR